MDRFLARLQSCQRNWRIGCVSGVKARVVIGSIDLHAAFSVQASRLGVHGPFLALLGQRWVSRQIAIQSKRDEHRPDKSYGGGYLDLSAINTFGRWKTLVMPVCESRRLLDGCWLEASFTVQTVKGGGTKRQKA